MPELCRFFGIVIYMYREVGGKHHFPHIHASHGSNKAVFSIDTAELMEGFFPKKERKLVEAWIEIRKDKLKLNWMKLNTAAGSPSFFRIDPLQ